MFHLFFILLFKISPMSDFQYNELIDSIYSLSLEDKIEIKNLLEHNIADSRRDEIHLNYLISTDEVQEFSNDINDLKKMLE
jgi:hypothetical protein